jgi:hypothetical protein
MSGDGSTMRTTSVVLALLIAMLAAGCVVYEPVPAYAVSSTTDRAFNAALGAVQDAGVRVSSADQGSGQIRGTKDAVDVSVSVVRQPDGRTRVQIDSRGPSGHDTALAERISAAYERRMGR